MRKVLGSWSMLAGAVAVATVAGASSAAADCGNRADFVRGRRMTVLGLTAQQHLVRFRECSPDKLVDLGAVSGFQGADSALVGIDFRVQGGALYGVGNAGGVYTIDTETAVLALVNRLTEPLEGTAFGVDFNPAADRLRIISDTGQNLRHNVNSGGTTVRDALLTIVTTGTTVGTATGVTGAAYTNNDLRSETATTLFDVDTVGDRVVVQSPPNGIPGGAVANLAPSGALDVDADGSVGFDVYTRLERGVPVDNLGFASFTAFGAPAFYRIDLLTGRANFIGVLAEPMIDIALPLDQ